MSAEELPAREAMEFDVVIVGAGPAGLAAAIRLKQLAPDTSVGRGRKGLRGRRPHPLGRRHRSRSASTGCMPDWRNEDTPIKTKVSDDRFYWLSAAARGAAAQSHDAAADEQSRQLHRLAGQRLPLARHQGGGARASKSIPGFAAAEVLFDDNGAVVGRRHRRHGRRPRTASTRTASPAAWSCAPNTRCSPKARAATSARRCCSASASTKAASRRNSGSA